MHPLERLFGARSETGTPARVPRVNDGTFPTGKFLRIAISQRRRAAELTGLDEMHALPALIPALAKRFDALILREKDLDETGYLALAEAVKARCDETGLRFVVHGSVEAARQLGAEVLHLPLPVLRKLGERPERLALLGASVHSLDEAREAAKLGADYLLAGHVFPTACKEGLTPRGLAWLRDLVEGQARPVIALGGIDDTNEAAVRATGVVGAARMSGAMREAASGAMREAASGETNRPR